MVNHNIKKVYMNGRVLRTVKNITVLLYCVLKMILKNSLYFEYIIYIILRIEFSENIHKG